MATAVTGQDPIANRPVRRARERSRGAASVLAMALTAAACGGETNPGIGNGTVPSTSTTTTTTTSPEPTTTIDFNRPVDQSDTPIPEDATIADIAEVIEDIRGQTDDVSRQVARLVDFPSLTSQTGAQIMDLVVAVTPDDAGFRHTATVRYRVPTEPATLIQLLQDDLRGRSWNRAAREETVSADEVTITEMVFRDPGTIHEDKELLVAVRDGAGPTTVDLDFHGLTDDDDERFGLLAAWQEPVRIPSGGTLVEAGLGTAEDLGTLAVVYELTAETAAEARDDVLGLVRDAEFEIRTAEQSGESAAPAILVDPDGAEYLLAFAPAQEAGVVAMTVSTTFPLTPLD